MDANALSAAYTPATEAFDEMAAADGSLRPHWSYVAQALDGLGPVELRHRANQLGERLREDGVRYVVYDGAERGERAWRLDPVPLLVTSAEWRELELGLQQRAELLELILRDLYGPRDLLRKGLIPDALIYTHPGFLRPCADLLPATGQALLLYAADLVRGPDGVFRVLSDRTQAPSGAGYALANRLAVSRTLPSLFREAQVHRLASFFQALRSVLTEGAAALDEPAHTVLLTPGPLNETYFEHRYLADYLGLTLATGPELSVRGGRVWLRSLGRQLPVGAILRRVDDDYCDPLALRPESLLGVAGLTEAIRRGQVGVVNPLGSGVLENAGLMAYLPRLARELLGQDLRLESPPTWWCGDPQQRDHVLTHLPGLVIKPIARRAGDPTSIHMGRLSETDRAAWGERLRAEPMRWAAQEVLETGHAPALGASGLEPRRSVLRTYLIARDAGYVLMPGGLTRSAPDPETTIISNQAGAIAKDTWVLASEPTPEPRAMEALSPVPMPGDVEEIPSATADGLFWLGRYGERALHGGRLLREGLRRLNDDLGEGLDVVSAHRARVLRVLHTHCLGTGAVPTGPDGPATESALAALLGGGSGRRGLVWDLQAVRRNAQAQRHYLPPDVQESVAALQTVATALETPSQADTLNHSALSETLTSLATHLVGLLARGDDGMRHGSAWTFLRLGRDLERALLTAGLVRGVLGEVDEPVVEIPLLRFALAASQADPAHDRRHGPVPRPASVLDVLLQDVRQPMALAHRLRRLQDRLQDLPAVADEAAPRLGAKVADAAAGLDTAVARGLAEADATGQRGPLIAYLESVCHGLRDTSEQLTTLYFTETGLPRPL